jgi:hypothetical protein
MSALLNLGPAGVVSYLLVLSGLVLMGGGVVGCLRGLALKGPLRDVKEDVPPVTVETATALREKECRESWWYANAGRALLVGSISVIAGFVLRLATL